MEIKSQLSVDGIKMTFFKCLSEEDYQKMPEIYTDKNGVKYGKSRFILNLEECVYRDDEWVIIAA